MCSPLHSYSCNSHAHKLVYHHHGVADNDGSKWWQVKMFLIYLCLYCILFSPSNFMQLLITYNSKHLNIMLCSNNIWSIVYVYFAISFSEFSLHFSILLNNIVPSAMCTLQVSPMESCLSKIYVKGWCKPFSAH